MLYLVNQHMVMAESARGYTKELAKKSSPKVWSLTQLYSVDFSKSRIDVKSAFSTNAQSRFASVVVDGSLGPLRLAWHS